MGRGKEEEPVNPWLDELRQALVTDPWLAEHKTLLTSREGFAWKGDKLYVPPSLRSSVLKRSHDVKPAGHFGFLKTLHLARLVLVATDEGGS